MSLSNFRGLAVLLFFGTASLAWAAPPEGYDFVAYDEGMQRAQQENKKAFLYFGRYGCGFCQKTNVESFSDKNVREIYSKNYVLIYVDAESGRRLQLPNGESITEMELGARLNAFATPVFLYLEPDGQVVMRAPGFKTVEDFINLDKYVQGGFYRHMSINEFLAQQGHAK
ncbi:MAG: thioredoxin fold domain-containing protein [Gammaproteobacteria bacterium]